MPILINPFPVGSQQARFVTGQPVASQHVMSIQSDLAWLCGYVVQPVCSVILPSPNQTSNTIYVTYRKSSGAKLLMIQVEVHGGHGPDGGTTTSSGGQGHLQVTVNGGTATWSASVGVNLFDGVQLIATPNTDTWDHPTYTQYLDVSALTNGSWNDIGFAWLDASSNASRGLYSINVHELAAPQADPVTTPTTEIGESLQWCQPRFPIVDGAATGSIGLERALGEQERARYQNRRQGMQLLRPETVIDAFFVTSTTAGAAFPYEAYVASSAPSWRVRARNLYGTSGFNQYLMRVRYKNSSTQQLIIRAAVTPVGGSTTFTTYTLANSTSFVATTVSASSSPLALSIPCSGTSQEADIVWTAWQTAAGSSYISQLALAENET